MPTGAARFWYGNSVVGTSLWPGGVVAFRPGGAGSMLSGGALRMKFYWLKSPDAQLKISGHLVDNKAMTLRVELNHQYDTRGGQPSYLIFPTPGCWRLHVEAGGQHLSFVTLVTRDSELAPATDTALRP
jgi:hypothetical protein